MMRMGSPNQFRQAPALLRRQPLAVVHSWDEAMGRDDNRPSHHRPRQATTPCFIDARNCTVSSASKEILEALHQPQTVRLSKKLPF